MKKLLFILLIALTYGFAPTLDTKPTNAKPLQTPSNVTFYYHPSDTSLGVNMSGIGYLRMIGVRKIQFKIDSLASHMANTLQYYRLLTNHDSLSRLQEKSYNSLDDKPNLALYRTLVNHDSLSTLQEKNYASLNGKPNLAVYRLNSDHDSLSNLQEKNYSSLDGKPDLTLKLDKNTAITGETKTKIAYDSKGLVIGGSDATTIDISPSTDRKYVTDAEKIVIGNTSGTNTGNQTLSGTDDEVSHTVALSGSGGSIKLKEGANITLTTDVTGFNSEVTISATGSGGSGASGTVTSVTAGNGMTQTGTMTINPTLNIVSHAGAAGAIGTMDIEADAIGVNLGTTSTSAYRGDYGNTAYNHSQLTSSNPHITSLAQQSDVDLVDGGSGVPVYNDLMVFNSSTIKWRNQSPIEAGLQLALNGTGFVKATGTSISYDNSTYLTEVLNSSVTFGKLSTYNSAINGDMLTYNSTYGLQWSTPLSGIGSTGRVAYWDGANSLASNADFLYDSTNGLSLTKPVKATEFTFGSTGWTIAESSGKLVFKYNGAPVMSLDQSGNVKAASEIYRGGL